jgi:hypothetical protein
MTQFEKILSAFERLMGATCESVEGLFAQTKLLLKFIEGQPDNNTQHELWRILLSRCRLVHSDMKIGPGVDEIVSRTLMRTTQERWVNFYLQFAERNHTLDEVVTLTRTTIEKFETADERAAFLAHVLFCEETFVPYSEEFRAPGCESGSFAELAYQVAGYSPLIRELTLPGAFKRNLDRASAFLQLLESEPDKAKRVMLLSGFLTELHANNSDPVTRLLESMMGEHDGHGHGVYVEINGLESELFGTGHAGHRHVMVMGGGELSSVLTSILRGRTSTDRPDRR